MFRPYNLRSIAIWTAASIAGNHAYYKVKQKNSGGITRTKTTTPPSVQRLIDRLNNISEQTNALHDSLRDCLGDGQFNFTPAANLYAYADWLSSHKNEIKEDIRRIYQQTIDDGYSWESDVIHNLQVNVDGISENIEETRQEVIQIVNGLIGKDVGEDVRKKVFDGIDQLKNQIRVHKTSWKLIPNDRTFIVKFKAPEPIKNPVKEAKPVKKPLRKFTTGLYIARDSATYGPYTYAKIIKMLKDGGVTQDTLIAYDGAPEWVPLKEFTNKING